MFGQKYLVKQYDSTDCAAACLATICMYYKREITITKLRDILGTDIKGTTLKGLEDGANKLGFDTKAIRVDKEGFISKYTLPAIAHLITDEGFSHFVIIHKIKKNNVIILDPAKGKKKQDVDEFFKSFDGILLLLIPNNDFMINRYKKESTTISKFIKILLPQKKLFIVSIITSIILTILGIASSFFNKILMDEILPYGLKNQLLIFSIGFMVIGVTEILITTIRQHMLLYLSQKIDIPLLLGYFKHVYRLPSKFFATRKVGDILTRFSDAFTIKNILTSVTLSLIIDIILAIVSAVVLCFMNGTLFLVVLCLTFVSTLLIFIFKQPYKKINIRQMESSAKLNSTIIESLKGIDTIKFHAAEEKIMEKLEVAYIKNLKITFKEGVLSNIQNSISSLISSIGNLVLMFIGASMVMDGKTTLGSLMAFTSLSGYFMGPIGRLIGLQLSIQEASISLKRLSEIYEVEEEQEVNEEKIKIDRIDGDIVLKDITFRYGSRQPVIKDLNIKIPKGKKVALVGESGSGKTTLSRLLLKSFEPEKGKINICGHNIKQLDIYSLRKSIAYVPQNVELFSGTIKENVILGKESVSYGEIKTACEDAGCDSFIERLPGKYDTFLEEAGGGLSGGEKQRIALARALVKNTDFLILDEATSNLDFISEAKIYNTIFVKSKNKTMLIIAHRLSTIRNCDIIYVLDKGQVIESGDHKTLLNKRGKYYELYVSQVGKVENENIDISRNNNKRIDKKNISENIREKNIVTKEEEYEYK
ncbi:ABC transporter permease [Clostridium botulinum]|uniref:peptidase domain-containing ABC transporter n=1 Tax=Clostridium botulinum TaxID=1491 RepID=UPI0013F804E1|nr:peptidase domain-containing ABC transporter [Clostridium botulinum]MBN3408269.1 ABC transporter permease [Clostridium botulinum]MBY6798006.1 peptidase domain-containing ABC transporter [Clostridium botulinum]MBY6866992.1 peptidase domain-containing ABC transporter [Clostridium botulinum]MBY6874990.1 peptidase domain-containing ABC transporter [Clostridium botulinum]MBY6889650.1 peptidase domain-containing ABC transporter [Clostridium botulinum]